MKKWQRNYSQILCDHPFMTVRADSITLPNGVHIPDYTIWQHSDIVQAIPITKEGKYVLVKQYKHGIEDIVVEFPGGFMNKGESKIDALKRELAEETSYICNSTPLKLTSITHHPTKETGLVHLYLCKGVIKYEDEQHQTDDTEFIEVVELSTEELENYLFNSPYVQSGTMLGYLLSLR